MTVCHLPVVTRSRLLRADQPRTYLLTEAGIIWLVKRPAVGPVVETAPQPACAGSEVHIVDARCIPVARLPACSFLNAGNDRDVCATHILLWHTAVNSRWLATCK